MIKHLPVLMPFAFALLASTAISAETTKAPCGSFQKLPDGNWRALKPVKIENGKLSAVIGQGTTIGPNTRVTGVNIYAELQKSCN